MSSSEELEDQFAIVQFLEQKKLKSVDLILQSWTFRQDRKLMCRYPPMKDALKVRNWVMKKKDFQDSWPTYPIKLIATAENFEQGERRLKRSFTTINVESSEPEITTQEYSSLLSQVDVSNTLSQVQPLSNILSNNLPTKDQSSNGKNTNTKNISIEESEFEASDSLSDKAQSSEKTNKDDNLQLFKEELKEFIKLELNKIKRSILYDLKKNTDEIKEAISIQGAKKSVEDSPWKILNFTLPRETDDAFLEFEDGLLADQTKQNALKEIFHLVTIGSTNYVHDVHNIIKKMVNKSVQLLYSGAGRKVKGQEKKSFAQTQTYKCMNDFLLDKYKDSKEKINVLTATSHFLSGANDRDGGKKNRKPTNENS